VRTFVVRPLSTFGALGTALQNRTDLFIDIESQDGKMFARDRLVREFEARSFALLPLVLENKLIGCLYFDSGPEVVEVTETVCGLLKTMRDHLASAFAKHRQNATANAA
jgi:GAF domain-containing protein